MVLLKSDPTTFQAVAASLSTRGPGPINFILLAAHLLYLYLSMCMVTLHDLKPIFYKILLRFAFASRRAIKFMGLKKLNIIIVLVA